MTHSPKKHKRKRKPQTDKFANALAHHRAGRLAEAERLYCEIHRSSPSRGDVAHLLGLVSYRLGKTQTAVEMLRLATELEPDNADAHNDLGNVLQEAGQPDQAERAYRRAIEANSAHATAHNNLGVVLKNKDQLDEAADAYRRAIQLDPSDSHTYYNLGVVLKKTNDLDGAADALRRAVELQPDSADACQALCAVLRRANRLAELEAALDEWLDRDPANPVAHHLRAAVTGNQIPTRASDEYVRSVFDQFAPTFDRDLRNLGYEFPRLVGSLVEQAVGPARKQLAILDAGCGTGLCGVQLRPFATRLDGVDLSPKMIEKATQRGIYDRLEVQELTAYMNDHADAYDLIVAGDTFNYFGDLQPLFAAARLALNGAGRLIFTLELDQDGSDQRGFQLQLHGRYNHALSYVTSSLEDAGFQIDAREMIVVRRQANKDVEGMLVRASR